MKKLFFLSVFFMISCQLVIDVDVPYGGDKIVVNAVQELDTAWRVDLSRTRYILDGQYDYPPIDNASVIIHNPDGTTEALVNKGNGQFASSSLPEPGKMYKITVDADGLEGVEGEMKMPSIVKIIDIVWDSAQMDSDPRYGDGTGNRVPFRLTLSDPPGENNYYDVNVNIYIIYDYTNYMTGEEMIDTLVSFRPTYTRDPALSTEGEGKSEFTDEVFGGKTYTIPFITELVEYPNTKTYKIEVSLTTLSEGLYRFSETRVLQTAVGGDPFAQPVQVKSNMSNGFGVFGGTATDIRVFKR